MLIPYTDLVKNFNLNVTGILHVGAHDCEELSVYNSCGVLTENIYWIEAMRKKVKRNKQRIGDKLNIFQCVVYDENDKEVEFNITNNGQSSSILPFGSHSMNHPKVKVVSKEILKTTRLDKLIDDNQIPIEKLNFINLDIQGVELRALKSMEKYLQHINYIYTEVNTEQVYQGCDEIDQIDEYLNKFGFERLVTKVYQNLGWGDAFYIKK